MELVDDAGVADPILTPRPDQSHPSVGCSQLLADSCLGRACVQPPQVLRWPNLDRVVVDPQVDRLRGPAGDDQHVKARLLERSPPIAAGLAIADGAGQRRLGGHVEAGEARKRRSGEHAGSKDQEAGRVEGIEMGGYLAQHVDERHTAPTPVAAVEIGRWGLHRDGFPAEIDFEDPTVISVRHLLTSSFLQRPVSRRFFRP
jgi:hypothetical protein